MIALWLRRFPARRAQENSMHEHGPNCLEGPIRGSHAWWRGLDPLRSAADCPGQENGIKGEAQGSNVRQDLVERVRREVQAGSYDTPEKWQAALDRLLQRLDQ